MHSASLRAAILLAMLALATGCGRHTGAFAIVAAAMIVQAGTNDSMAYARPAYEDPYLYPYPPASAKDERAPPASPRDRVPASDGARPFDAQRARAALASVDVGPCRDSGAPRGYGHAVVTFNPDGRASKVVVDAPSGLSAGAAKCIGDRLGTATVPEYGGSFVDVGTTWFVR